MSDAPNPDPPCYAVIFTTRRTSGDDGYSEMAARMERLASQQPGYLGIESVRGADGAGITVSYWKDLESINAWRESAEHRDARERGRRDWYESYTTRICVVERAYSFQRSQDRARQP